jgi:hypothetical protein
LVAGGVLDGVLVGTVGVRVGVRDGVRVGCVAVRVGVFEGVLLGTVAVGVRLGLRVLVTVGESVLLGVNVMVGVHVRVGVGVRVLVWVGVDVKSLTLPVSVQVPHPGKLKVRVTVQEPTKVGLAKSASQVANAPLPSIIMPGAVGFAFIGEVVLLVL